ncbi:MAG: Ig-like domain-containing protein, partial [Bacteroidales bacterium]|nr:Ig-like domain-containing protein [Bacteroidales bacterium]
MKINRVIKIHAVLKMNPVHRLLLIPLVLLFLSCEKKEDNAPETDTKLEITSARVGKISLSASSLTENAPVDKPLVLNFSGAVDTSTLQNNIELYGPNSEKLDLDFFIFQDRKSISAAPEKKLDYNTQYRLNIKEGLKGEEGETFPGAEYRFKTENGTLKIQSIKLNEKDFSLQYRIKNIDFQTRFVATFNAQVEKEGIDQQISLSHEGEEIPLTIGYRDGDSTLVVENEEPLDYYLEYTFQLDRGLRSAGGFDFDGFQNSFYTRLDSTDKFPRIPDEELLTQIQEQTFKYFWDHAHPDCGLARERNTSNNTVTSGGSGFGIMSIIVGIERGFITRTEGMERMEKILSFLEDDNLRFHGAWPHWMNGSTGEVVPFSEKDNGGDLVETA